MKFAQLLLCVAVVSLLWSFSSAGHLFHFDTCQRQSIALPRNGLPIGKVG
jgi:hypothetical protein